MHRFPARAGAATAARHPALAPLLAAGFPPAGVAAALRCHAAPARRYHGRRHVLAMLDTALAVGALPTPAQALAILFHDAVCRPGAPAGRNEAQSARLLRRRATGLAPATVALACRIVLDTATHVASCKAARLVVDLDLAALGAPAAVFERHTRALRAEQRTRRSAPPDREFHRQRAAFFRRLLARPAIYRLPLPRARFEARARANLRRALDRMGGG